MLASNTVIKNNRRVISDRSATAPSIHRSIYLSIRTIVSPFSSQDIETEKNTRRIGDWLDRERTRSLEESMSAESREVGWAMTTIDRETTTTTYTTRSSTQRRKMSPLFGRDFTLGGSELSVRLSVCAVAETSNNE